ncbi:MAG: thiamine-phosphate kinase [Betaproteobacteria bacterium]|jgi:thiamine-monophosphate kinase|nr:thiamine-phosphate kinase [Betaproteobacteria bacterium]
MANLGEFEFIAQLLQGPAAQGQPFYRHPLALGIGDDAALIPPLGPQEQLAVASDMLIEGRHYFADCDPRSLGHKVLAVNLSDLAAMGARPLAFTLSAGLREIRRPWIESFLDGMLSLARESQCPLIGGDTTAVGEQAPEVFSVTALGVVQAGTALRRDGLRPGDDLWVSGHLGDAAFALAQKINDPKLNCPQPRLALGLGLVGLASAAIDISDGLQSELMHLLNGAQNRAAQPQRLQANLNWQKLPLGPLVKQAIQAGRLMPPQAAGIAITGGDEYELLFGASPRERIHLQALGEQLSLALTRIGSVDSSDRPVVCWRDASGQPPPEILQDMIARGGFRHF